MLLLDELIKPVLLRHMQSARNQPSSKGTASIRLRYLFIVIQVTIDLNSFLWKMKLVVRGEKMEAHIYNRMSILCEYSEDFDAGINLYRVGRISQSRTNVTLIVRDIESSHFQLITALQNQPP